MTLARLCGSLLKKYRHGLFAALTITSLVAPAKAATLTVYAAMGYGARLAHAFSQATGIRVNLVHLSTGPLLARVQAEAARPQWDVLWFDGNLAMREFAHRRILACGWRPAVDYLPQGRALLPPDRCYYPVGVTLAGVVLVNERRLPQKAWPRRWSDLLDRSLRDKVGMDNPAISGPTYPFVAGMMQHLGTAGGKRYFSRLKANGLRVFPRNSATLRALQYGQIDVAVVQSSAALGMAARHPGLRVLAPSPSILLPSDIAIGAGVHGPKLRAARRFVQYVLSPAGQKILLTDKATADSNYEPLLARVHPPAVLAPLAGVHALVLDPAKWGPMEPAIVNWFTAHVTG